VKLVQSLDVAFMIRLGEKIAHPIFGEMEVVFISQASDGTYEMLCKLFEFNNSLKVFDALSLSRIKFKVNGLRRVK
jgi:hypothetical protein